MLLLSEMREQVALIQVELCVTVWDDGEKESDQGYCNYNTDNSN